MADQRQWNPWIKEFSDFHFDEKKMRKLEEDLANPPVSSGSREHILWRQRLSRMLTFWEQTGAITQEERKKLYWQLEKSNRYQATVVEIASSIAGMKAKWEELKKIMKHFISIEEMRRDFENKFLPSVIGKAFRFSEYNANKKCFIFEIIGNRQAYNREGRKFVISLKLWAGQLKIVSGQEALSMEIAGRQDLVFMTIKLNEFQPDEAGLPTLRQILNEFKQ